MKKINIIKITVVMLTNYCFLFGYSFSQKTGSFKDEINGVVYKTVEIGQQTWMAEGLKATKFRDGSIVNRANNEKEWQVFLSKKIPAYIINNTTREYLYNVYAINDTRGLTPSSFSIPTMDDFIQLGVQCGGKRSFMVNLSGSQSDWIENVSTKLRNEFWSNPGKNIFDFNINRTGMVQYNGEITYNASSFIWFLNGHIELIDKQNGEITYEEFSSKFADIYTIDKETYKLFVKSLSKENMFIYSEDSDIDSESGYSIRGILK
jgi:uncharacterized protein (TIGR02145 family)